MGMSRLTMATSFGPGRSFAVTKTTFDQSNDGSCLIPTIFPWGTSLLTVPPYQQPGKGMSSTYWAFPETLSQASTLTTDFPTIDPSFLISLDFSSASSASSFSPKGKHLLICQLLLFIIKHIIDEQVAHYANCNGQKDVIGEIKLCERTQRPKPSASL